MAASNWHWRTREVRPWAESWLAEQISPLETGGISIRKVTIPEGDCELGHRKGRLLTIYDMRVEAEWQAMAKDGQQIAGVLTCPEMAHDMDNSAYQFESTVTTGSGTEAEAFRSAAQKQLGDLIRPIFGAFPKAMLDTHGSSLKAQSTPGSSGTSTPIAGVTTTTAHSATSSKEISEGASSKLLNTSTVRVTAEFMTTAEELFDLLTNEQKVPMWSRNPAKIKAEKGADISLFNGNIMGQMTEVDRPKSFVSTWRAPTWPAQHYGEMRTSLSQGSDSTTLELRLAGVPKGQEDAVERNLDVLYIKSLKSIGSAISSLKDAPQTRNTRSISGSLLFGGLPFVLSFALIVGLATAILLGPTGTTWR